MKELLQQMNDIMENKSIDGEEKAEQIYDIVARHIASQPCPFCGANPTLGCPTCEKAGRV